MASDRYDQDAILDSGSSSTAEHNLCTRILYNGRGIEADSPVRWHCWITERVIPLKAFIKLPCANLNRCVIAAFICLLKAAECGFYITNVSFDDLGVKLTGFATEHTVVIMDAGSNGWHPERPRWGKSQVNKRIMHKFWPLATNHNIDVSRLQAMWQDGYTVKLALEGA